MVSGIFCFPGPFIGILLRVMVNGFFFKLFQKQIIDSRNGDVDSRIFIAVKNGLFFHIRDKDFFITAGDQFSKQMIVIFQYVCVLFFQGSFLFQR